MACITVRINTRTPDQTREPILYKVGTNFQVSTNIRRAQVNENGGFLEIDIEGELEDVQRAISWLHTTGLHIDAKQRSVGKDTVNL
jgi:ABC-type methionine transport system ATPase subunit